MEQITFPFFRLPAELQAKVLNNISLYSDLKQLCLVSKKFSDIAIPRLYYKLDLRTKDDFKTGVKVDWDFLDTQILPKIYSLLLNPANLCFVRILKTGVFGMESTILMNQLLPLFKEDSLLKFSYYTMETIFFPTPLQLKSLLDRQKHLQNLELYSHMVPWLEKFLDQHESSRKAIVKSFTKLVLGSSMEKKIQPLVNLLWPLKNLNLFLLQSLILNGSQIPDHDTHSIIKLFTSHYFFNLTKLVFIKINFKSTLILNNTPLLRSLIIHSCRLLQGSDLILEFPDSIQIQSITSWTNENIKVYTNGLSQYQRLRYLINGNTLYFVYYANQVLIVFIRISYTIMP